MARTTLAALLFASATAFAQTAPSSPAAADPKAQTSSPATSQPGAQRPAGATATQPVPPPAAESTATREEEAIRREVETRVEAAKKELREELRAQLAAEAAGAGWQEEATEERRKLELFVLDGYFRSRPDLFHKFDLGRGQVINGLSDNQVLWARRRAEATVAGVNMRARFEPTFNVSEEVRVRAQIDALDNLLWGSTPEYAASTSDWNQFGGVFGENQVPPQDSLRVRRVYGEVSTPVGIFRFGRMGSHWGLGMLRNDGNCFDCDFGDTVDRFQFVTEPFAGWYVAPMLDFNAEGPSSFENEGMGQPWDVSQYDDAHSYVLAIARRDTEQQAKAKLDNGGYLLNGGVHFTYRSQRNAPTAFVGNDPEWVTRAAQLYVPDVWVKFERKQFRLELEAAAVLGSIGSRGQTFADDQGATNTQPLEIAQFGATFQGEFRALENKLKVGGEIGFASGDRAFGLGNSPGRAGSGANRTQAGDIDGPQYNCAPGDCRDEGDDFAINNFRFNRDYRIDMILWREILGGVTDAIYVKPTVDYEIAPGFNVFGAAIYSRTVFARSAPNSAADTSNGELGTDLGLEFNAGAKYETDDGFFFQLQWGLLIPLEGLKSSLNPNAELDTAQALRAQIGIKF